MTSRSEPDIADRVRAYAAARLQGVLQDDERARFVAYCLLLVRQKACPPATGSGVNWRLVAACADIAEPRVRAAAASLRPLLEAISRHARRTYIDPAPSPVDPVKPKPGRRANPHVPAPEPMFDLPVASAPTSFAQALRFQMARHNDSKHRLHAAVVGCGECFQRQTLRFWHSGEKEPVTVESHRILARIEERYRLPAGYFKAYLSHRVRQWRRPRKPSVRRSTTRRLSWHLPEDFHSRSQQQQAEILHWVETTVGSGGTAFRRYQICMGGQRFRIHFAADVGPPALGAGRSRARASSRLDAPAALAKEMGALLDFKTSALTPVGFRRKGVWNLATALQRRSHLSLLLGALAAPSASATRGLGVPRAQLTLALLVLPQTWHWYLHWRHQRRGFYTRWESDMLMLAMSLVRRGTGWLRQNPGLGARLQPIEGLVGAEAVARVQADWPAACDAMWDFASDTIRELRRLQRTHRDPFEPIRCVLEAERPLAEYRKIAEEVLRHLPDERFFPEAAAEGVRAFLMLRLGLHLGFRQKNLRELLVCERGERPRSELSLAEAKVGELRWSEPDKAWEVFIPSTAFKNASSSFFRSKPFRLQLPDLADLYVHLEAYLQRHRKRLLGGFKDPKTFFVKTVGPRTTTAVYDHTGFYQLWRIIIERYGVFNPYTGRGAIAGLLPHGPHSVRDVLATHVLKRTGSYTQASYAIQDTPQMVALHYGRLLPAEKAAIAARVLNEVWRVSPEEIKRSGQTVDASPAPAILQDDFEALRSIPRPWS